MCKRDDVRVHEILSTRFHASVTGIMLNGVLAVQFVNEGTKGRKAVVPADTRCVTKLPDADTTMLDTSVQSAATEVAGTLAVIPLGPEMYELLVRVRT